MIRSWRSGLLLLCLIASNVALGQNLAEDEGILSTGGYSRMIGIGVGATYRSFLDKGISELVYSGVAPTVTLSSQKTDEYKFTELSLQASYLNKMKRDAGNLLPGTASSLKGAIDYRYVYKLKVLNEDTWDVRVGPMLSALFDYRNAEHLNFSSKSWEYAFTLGVNAKIVREVIMNGDRRGSAGFDISIPFVADIGRPPYNNTNGIYDPTYNDRKGFFSTNQLGTFGKFFRLNTRVHVIYPLKNGNKFRFTYAWDYYKVKGKSIAYSAEHNLMVAFMFNY